MDTEISGLITKILMYNTQSGRTVARFEHEVDGEMQAGYIEYRAQSNSPEAVCAEPGIRFAANGRWKNSTQSGRSFSVFQVASVEFQLDNGPSLGMRR